VPSKGALKVLPKIAVAVPFKGALKVLPKIAIGNFSGGRNRRGALEVLPNLAPSLSARSVRVVPSRNFPRTWTWV